MRDAKATKTNPTQRSSDDLKALDPESQISRKLRALYDSVQEETIPERFLDLLEKLDAAEEKAAQKPSQGSTGGGGASANENGAPSDKVMTMRAAPGEGSSHEQS